MLLTASSRFPSTDKKCNENRRSNTKRLSKTSALRNYILRLSEVDNRKIKSFSWSLELSTG